MTDHPARNPTGQHGADRRSYRPPARELVLHPPQFVPLTGNDEQAALTALAELLAPLFQPTTGDGDSHPPA